MADTVGEVMTPNPATIDPDAPVAGAARLMREQDIGAVVVADDGRPVGIVTDRDIAVRVVAEGRDPRETPVRDAASGDVEAVRPDTKISDATELMRLRAVRRLPVVEGGTIVGIVSLGDLAVERDRESVLGQISAMPGNR
jgi:CBS domain-containing protein